jgi:hypothetical protein
MKLLKSEKQMSKAALIKSIDDKYSKDFEKLNESDILNCV